jgi:hypothetical protein
MPFKSKAQIRTCYGLKSSPKKISPKGKKSSPKKWNCDKFLKETPSICNMHDKFSPSDTKRRNVGHTKTKTPVQKGPRGGHFFYIIEKDKNGKEVCRMKVYVKSKL